jgi:hypothetical protein
MKPLTSESLRVLGLVLGVVSCFVGRMFSKVWDILLEAGACV